MSLTVWQFLECYRPSQAMFSISSYRQYLGNDRFIVTVSLVKATFKTRLLSAIVDSPYTPILSYDTCLLPSKGALTHLGADVSNPLHIESMLKLPSLTRESSGHSQTPE